ncbi:annexin D7-like [Asparagus officinalis]|uniref:annexin D7-like n=1 Tax=Asparagus officinalis TaxID=4686 RepID=UPI00098E7A81|nr:annexin D7-like [Asparagus officinalis]
MEMNPTGNGSSSDQSKIVEIIAHRNTEELKFVRQTYSFVYNQDLLQLLSQKSNLFTRVLYLQLSEPHNRDAEIIRRTFSGRSLDLSILTEIICTRSSSDLRIVKEAYHSRYNADLRQDISYKMSGILKEILVAVLNSSNYSTARVDVSLSMCDAKTLYEAVGSGKYVDQNSIISILSQRSTCQIKSILSSYKQLYGHEFIKFLKKDRCGEFGKQLRVVIRCIQSPEKQFAKQLRAALKTGNAQETLIRIVVTRAGTDIRQINATFTAKTGWSLESLIRNEFNNSSCYNTDGAYSLVGDVLIALLRRA